jgi:ribosomal protein L44E
MSEIQGVFPQQKEKDKKKRRLILICTNCPMTHIQS